MITKNDLYDMTAVLINIRNDIYEELNVKILVQMIKVLKNKINTDDNQIRKAIASIEEIENECWFFVNINNVYVNHQLMKKDSIYVLLEKLFNELICELEHKNFDKAYDLVDSFHCLPNIIADNNFTIPKTFWKTYIKCYRDKWDKEFLRYEQKNRKIYL